MNEFDLFKGLDSLSKNDYHWYQNLNDDGKKAVAPLVLTRWLSGTNDYLQIIKINIIANPYIFSLGNEKALLCKLLAASTTQPRRYQWLKGPGSANSSLVLKIISEYYDVSLREAALYVDTIDKNDLLEMAEELGAEKDILAKLKKEISEGKNGPGTIKKRSKK